MFDNLSERIESALKTLKGQNKITEINVAHTVKEIRKALLNADVSYNIAKKFTNDVKEKAIGSGVLTNISPGQLLIKITHDELANLMGNKYTDITIKGNPAIILISGLQGSGKTTFTAKLAHFLKKKKGKNPLLVAADVYRPAAIDQLHAIAEKVDVEVYSDKEDKKPLSLAKKAIKEAKSKGFDVVIIDTAGRLAVDEEMMKEIATLKKDLNPSETLFVVDAMTGQDAVNTAKTFNEVIDFDGVVLTKLDGDTRGGAALSIKAVVDKPIKFIGTGEKFTDLDVFHPSRMADRIMGMGDVVSLVERVQSQYDDDESRDLQKKIRKNTFDFNDFVKQIGMVKKMGNVKDLLGMIPGVGKQVKNLDIDESAFDKIMVIISSMTPSERSNPEIINQSRKDRIAKGSGRSIQEVNKLVKQFFDTRKMFKSVSNNKGKMPSLINSLKK